MKRISLRPAKDKGDRHVLIFSFGGFAPMLSVRRRAPRAFVGGIYYQVINRGNGRRAKFHKDGDYQAFVCQTFLAFGPRGHAIDKADSGIAGIAGDAVAAVALGIKRVRGCLRAGRWPDPVLFRNSRIGVFFVSKLT